MSFDPLSLWGTPAEWFGMAEGIVLTLLAQWAWRALYPVKPKPAAPEGRSDS